MIHPTPTKTLLTTTFESLVMQLSGSLARGTRLIDQFVQADPTPETTMAFELELSALLREVGRRIMAWTLNRLEPEADEAAPSRVEYKGRLYRRRRQHPHAVATLFGPVTLRRRLYEPLGGRGRSIHPLELRLGLEAGLATPALAERVGRWSTDHTQQEVLERLQGEHGVAWSCSSLRNVVGSLRAGMAPHREEAQVEQVLRWLEQARASKGRFRPTLAVGRDGIFVPLRHGVWQEGGTATVSVLDRRGKRVGTAYLGQMPESGQGTLTDQLSSLLKAILSRVDSQSLRLVYVTDEGHHPSTYDHRVLKKMVDPRRPWRILEWIRIVDFYHACQYVQQLADAIFGVGDVAQSWAQEMRHVLKTKADGVTRLLQSASALRRSRGLDGQAKLYEKAYRYIKKRTQWMRYHLYKRQGLPLGTDKKFESHFRVPPPVLSTGFNVLISLRVGSDASSSAPRGSLGAPASAVGVTGSDRADAPRSGERPEHPVITNGSNRGPDEPALLQACGCKGRWVSRQFEMAQDTTDDGHRPYVARRG